MTKDQQTPIRLKRIAIRDYKGIDRLEIDLPSPRMRGDSDILVMGSENGLGKTSVIECGSLLLLAYSLQAEEFASLFQYLDVDTPDLLIRTGCETSEISGDVAVGGKSVPVKIKISRNQEEIEVSRELREGESQKNGSSNASEEAYDLLEAIFGFTPNPATTSSFLLFHSHRKVQEGNPKLAHIVESESVLEPRMRMRHRRMRMRHYGAMSVFKMVILRVLMAKAGLFEDKAGLFEDKNIERHNENDEIANQLNTLIGRYASGFINKVRPQPDNTLDFRVEPKNGSGSFTFDGLSSGQKEIISTLFLIWYHTQDKPCVVFIDEPELHLNAQWHSSFVEDLKILAPRNQYILATHSEDIMASVDENQRILLKRSRT